MYNIVKFVYNSSVIVYNCHDDFQRPGLWYGTIVEELRREIFSGGPDMRFWWFRHYVLSETSDRWKMDHPLLPARKWYYKTISSEYNVFLNCSFSCGSHFFIFSQFFFFNILLKYVMLIVGCCNNFKYSIILLNSTKNSIYLLQ